MQTFNCFDVLIFSLICVRIAAGLCWLLLSYQYQRCTNSHKLKRHSLMFIGGAFHTFQLDSNFLLSRLCAIFSMWFEQWRTWNWMSTQRSCSSPCSTKMATDCSSWKSLSAWCARETHVVCIGRRTLVSLDSFALSASAAQRWCCQLCCKFSKVHPVLRIDVVFTRLIINRLVWKRRVPFLHFCDSPLSWNFAFPSPTFDPKVSYENSTWSIRRNANGSDVNVQVKMVSLCKRIDCDVPPMSVHSLLNIANA